MESKKKNHRDRKNPTAHEAWVKSKKKRNEAKRDVDTFEGGAENRLSEILKDAGAQ